MTPPSAGHDDHEKELERAAELMECPTDDIVNGMIQAALRSHVQVVILPAQDLLGLEAKRE